MDQLQKRLIQCQQVVDVKTKEFDRIALQWCPKLKTFTSDLGLRPSYVAAIFSVLFWGLYLIGLMMNVISKLFILFIPCYSAYKQLVDPNKLPTMTAFWLKYFLILLVWETIDLAIIDVIYTTGALYCLVKSFILFVLYQPQTKALENIFEQLAELIRPHESQLDEQLSAFQHGSLLNNDAVKGAVNVVENLINAGDQKEVL